MNDNTWADVHYSERTLFLELLKKSPRARAKYKLNLSPDDLERHIHLQKLYNVFSGQIAPTAQQKRQRDQENKVLAGHAVPAPVPWLDLPDSDRSIFLGVLDMTPTKRAEFKRRLTGEALRLYSDTQKAHHQFREQQALEERKSKPKPTPNKDRDINSLHVLNPPTPTTTDEYQQNTEALTKELNSNGLLEYKYSAQARANAPGPTPDAMLEMSSMLEQIVEHAYDSHITIRTVHLLIASARRRLIATRRYQQILEDRISGKTTRAHKALENRMDEAKQTISAAISRRKKAKIQQQIKQRLAKDLAKEADQQLKDLVEDATNKGKSK